MKSDTFDSTSIAHTLTVTALADMDANDTALLIGGNKQIITQNIDGIESNDCIHDNELLVCLIVRDTDIIKELDA